MITNLYSIYDRTAKLFGQPFPMANHKLAIRSTSDALKNPQCSWVEHPDDYTLVYVGTWDDETALLESTGSETIADISSLTGDNNEISN